MAKWIEYTPKITGKAQDLSYAGLTALLKLTLAQQEFGALKVTQTRPSWMSADTPRKEMLLRTMLLSCLGQYLAE